MPSLRSEWQRSLRLDDTFDALAALSMFSLSRICILRAVIGKYASMNAESESKTAFIITSSDNKVNINMEDHMPFELVNS